ncbi:MAG: hypothetical protein K2X77_20415 [Candidatus Obscuribacterales bacterium]|nr:hypothetical protein [Candidatus Obscuribacterales bacterium]
MPGILHGGSVSTGAGEGGKKAPPTLANRIHKQQDDGDLCAGKKDGACIAQAEFFKM